MQKTSYWADSYVQKLTSAKKALQHIQPGQRVFIGSSCGEPQHLVSELSETCSRFTDLEIVRLLSIESGPLTLVANRSHSQQFNIRSFYLGSASPTKIHRNKRFITPINLSQIPHLFKSRMMPLNAALIQASPPDDFGWMSLGVSVDITLAACESADIVICQTNPNMPRVLGRSFIHVNDVDYIVEHEEELLTIQPLPELETANTIARHISRLIDDGSTLQTNLGVTNEATMICLSEKNDIGVHSQYLSDSLMRLFSMGVITNKKKGFNDGKLVAGSAVGSNLLYEFIDDNPSIEFHPSDYINNPSIIARHNAMVTLNTAMAIDLTGQVAADALPFNNYTGINGLLDFTRGAAMSKGGKSILIMTSTSNHGRESRIIPSLSEIAVVVPRGDVQYVATEYGVVNLFGKTLQERAMALISIAHPDFRDELFSKAKELELIDIGRKFKQAIKGVYPLKYEETVIINEIPVMFRPAKPIDERSIQEHYYTMNRGDIVSRFFHEKKSFVHDQIDTTFEIDYINDLTIVATIGELGFEKIIAVGEYFRNSIINMAEIAFSVSKEYQHMGIAQILQKMLARAAMDNGIKGLVAYTSPENKGMKKLFYKLPYKVRSEKDEDMIILSCLFSEPKNNQEKQDYQEE
ncbi:bifunctional acetyl-CoA hydrolase/transferase family protein/GNAT family N-acetyltransferase [Desulfobacula toluolica]|uniref:Acetyl-CoA hydrolase/transferase family protein n=1 Tax=Desulfobacula toluolica (strain DSM 7467 / Tol2) TaxID=651182 RepID=K0NHI5_DESTT|nr:bifunctional acetyl-CoA hydrolase/transferase family protein/GNAT family N-acetyltransferase [Desulfobacula toluolica]CCK80405.1 acetyl-CoA hydrolase/transferase family protein [Desulfobacula toluolica Tol2]